MAWIASLVASQWQLSATGTLWARKWILLGSWWLVPEGFQKSREISMEVVAWGWWTGGVGCFNTGTIQKLTRYKVQYRWDSKTDDFSKKRNDNLEGVMAGGGVTSVICFCQWWLIGQNQNALATRIESRRKDYRTNCFTFSTVVDKWDDIKQTYILWLFRQIYALHRYFFFANLLNHEPHSVPE